MSTDRSRRHLILSLSRKGFGETILGLRLGADLRSMGDGVFFLAHDSSAKLLAERFPHFTLGSNASPFLCLYVNAQIQSQRPSTIILSDYYTTALVFEQYGMSPDSITSLGIPIVAIDTWHSNRAARLIDVFTHDSHDVLLWPGQVRSLCPVPFLAPDNNGSGFYQSLPEAVSLPKKIRRHVRHALGVDSACKLVMFCTAEWQHAHYESEAGRRMAASVPMLVGDYLSRMGEQVHLVHVGPKALNMGEHLQGRYHWMPSLSPESFDNIVASVDLLLSANISATTIAKAMVSEVPTLVLQNSVSAESVEEAEGKMKSAPTERLREWLKESMPLFPFALWPLGYHRFLEPLLQDNPYVAALEVAELLDEQAVEGALARLLFDEGHRAEHRHRQCAYIAQIRSLPTGAQLINQWLT